MDACLELRTNLKTLIRYMIFLLFSKIYKMFIRITITVIYTSLNFNSYYDARKSHRSIGPVFFFFSVDLILQKFYY